MTERLLALFNGLDRAHGEYTVKKDSSKVKTGGTAVTKKEPVTKELWDLHIKGKRGIGIIPIRDDSTCGFGAIDIDCYENFDPVTIANKIEENKWPLVTCRSKSGGAHVFLFLLQPLPATFVRGKLKEFALALGHPKAEIFPKQDKMLSKDDIGNWINMPYFDAEQTMRYAIYNTKAIDIESFIKLAENSRVSDTELAAVKIMSNEFSDAPPCLEFLTNHGFPRGSMNNALFDMGVYARMKYPDDWQAHVHSYNKRFMGPGDAKEVHQIVRSLDKKKYIYRCSEEPICSHCDKVICASREYGISSSSSPYKTSSGQKTVRPCILDEVEKPIMCYLPPEESDDEPYWVFTFHGKPMDVTIDMVSSQLKFIRSYLKKFRRVILPIDENRWAIAINELLAEAVDHEMAPDAGPEGQLWIHLEAFCTGKVKAKVKDELILGKPWKDTEGEEGPTDRIYFRSSDFMKYLDTQRFKEFKERALYAILRRNGAKHHKFMIKGKCVACWSVRPFDETSESFVTPNVQQASY